jgi:cell division protein FtsB
MESMPPITKKSGPVPLAAPNGLGEALGEALVNHIAPPAGSGRKPRQPASLLAIVIACFLTNGGLQLLVGYGEKYASAPTDIAALQAQGAGLAEEQKKTTERVGDLEEAFEALRIEARESFRSFGEQLAEVKKAVEAQPKGRTR